jgi:hypothetical protein
MRGARPHKANPAQCYSNPEGSYSRAASLLAGYPLLVSTLVFAVFSRTLADPDLWGHVKFGETLWKTTNLTLRDTYSYLTGGQPWINHEWLSEALFYLAFAIAGPPGLVALKTLIALSILLILYFSIYHQLKDVISTGILLILGSFILLLYLGSVRPQMFTFLLFLLVLAAVKNAEEGRFDRSGGCLRFSSFG